MTNDQFLEWDDVIDDGSMLLEPGEYPFTVKSFEKSRSKKDAHMAVITMEVGSDLKREIVDRFVLSKNMVWKIASFFRSIGLKKHGEKTKMVWDKVVGKTGMCTVFTEEYEADGKKRYSNKIDEYLDPEDIENDEDFSIIDDDDNIPF